MSLGLLSRTVEADAGAKESIVDFERRTSDFLLIGSQLLSQSNISIFHRFRFRSGAEAVGLPAHRESVCVFLSQGTTGKEVG